jgi:hypothetical protein
MNKIFIVTHYNLIEEEREILGTFNTRISAILFVKYLIKEGDECCFDIDMVEPLSMEENINRYKNGKSVTTLIATTLHRDVRKRGQIYLFNTNENSNGEGRVIDLFNYNIEAKEEDI